MASTYRVIRAKITTIARISYRTLFAPKPKKEKREERKKRKREPSPFRPEKKSSMDKQSFKKYICIVSLYIYIVSRSKATKEDEEWKERGWKCGWEVDVLVVESGSPVQHSFMISRWCFWKYLPRGRVPRIHPRPRGFPSHSGLLKPPRRDPRSWRINDLLATPARVYRTMRIWYVEEKIFITRSHQNFWTP